MTKQKCFIGGKLGLILKRYTHTVDVYVFKTKTVKTGVSRKYIKILPPEKKGNPNQLTINYEA